MKKIIIIISLCFEAGVLTSDDEFKFEELKFEGFPYLIKKSFHNWFTYKRCNIQNDQVINLFKHSNHNPDFLKSLKCICWNYHNFELIKITLDDPKKTLRKLCNAFNSNIPTLSSNCPFNCGNHREVRSLINQSYPVAFRIWIRCAMPNHTTLATPKSDEYWMK